MYAPYLKGLLVISMVATLAACLSAPSKSPVKEVQVESEVPTAQSYAIEDPQVGGAEALTAEPVIQGSALGAGTDVLLGEIVNGGPVYLSQFSQKVVLANYWSSSCMACAARLRDMASVSVDYQPFGLVVANVNIGDDPQIARAWLDERGLVDFSGLQLSDSSGLAAGSVRVLNTPATLLFDKNGMEIMRYDGSSTIDRVRKDLDLLLK